MNSISKYLRTAVWAATSVDSGQSDGQQHQSGDQLHFFMKKIHLIVEALCYVLDQNTK